MALLDEHGSGFSPLREHKDVPIERRCRLLVEAARHVLQFDRLPDGQPWRGNRIRLAALMHATQAELALRGA